MLVVDEYLAVRALAGGRPPELGDELLGLPASRHWRLLLRVHAPGTGQLSSALSDLPLPDRAALRQPDPEVLQVLDPRPLLDEAAVIAGNFGGAGLLVAETIAAGLQHGRALYFGKERNVGTRLAEIATELGIAVRVLA